MRIIIMRGPPGSGKSFFAEYMIGGCGLHGGEHQPIIVSADHFFMVNDEYRFDPKKLPMAHRECRMKFLEEVLNGSPMADRLGQCPEQTIVVDNTNTTAAECAFYYDLATIFTDDVQLFHVVRPPEMSEGEWIDQCVKKNQHGVPKKNIKDMVYRLGRRIPPYWNETKIERHEGHFVIKRQGGDETVKVPSFQGQEA